MGNEDPHVPDRSARLRRTTQRRNNRLNLDELNRIAKRLRVQRVMQPYLETVVL